MCDLAPVLYVSDEEKYLKAGVSAEDVFKASDEMLYLNANNPEGLYKIFSLFHEYGLPDSDIEIWFASFADYDVLADVVNNEEKWKKIGIEPNDYVDKYLMWRHILKDDPRYK
jgi:hypothetical protein